MVSKKKTKQAKTQKPKAQKKQTLKNRGVMVLSGSVLKPGDMQSLKEAKAILEKDPGLLVKLSDAIGKPITDLASGSTVIMRATNKALKAAVGFAVKTMDEGINSPSNDRWHKAAVTVAGGAGGAVGVPGLLVELPITTVMMLRSIADIARSNGENIASEEVKVECLTVFSLGSKDGGGYFELRSELAQAVTSAARYLASRGRSLAAPALVQLIEHIAARFSIQISQKAAAQAVPVIGAIGGAVINNLFMAHFQEMARAHFRIRKLEREYGTALIRQEYDNIKLPKKT